MRAAVNGVKPGLAVSGFTVVDESPKAVRLLRSVHTANKNVNGQIKRQESTLGVLIHIMRTFFSFECKISKCDC